jgi:WD40 repeat protein
LCLLLLAALPGCGGEDVDFSKPTLPPGVRSRSDGETSPPANTPVADAGKAEPVTTQDKPPGSDGVPGSTAASGATAATTAAAKPSLKGNSGASETDSASNLAKVSQKIEFDPAWLTDLDQVTAFSDDGSLVGVGSTDGRLRMFDVGAGAVRDVFPTQSASIAEVVVSPDNTVLGAVTSDGHLQLHSSNAAQGFDQYRQSRMATSIQQRGIGIHTARITAGAWQPQGTLLATAAADASIHLWRMPLRDAVDLAASGEDLAAITVNAENDVVATVAKSGQVRLLDRADQSVLREFTVEHSGTITRIALVKDSDTVLLGTQEGTIIAYSSLRGEEITRLTAHQGEVTCLTSSADGRSFLSADSAGQLRLWKLPLSASSQLARFDAEVDELRVTNDRRYAAALVRGQGLSLVRLAVPPVIRPVSGRSDDVTTIGFVPVGPVLAGASRGGIVRFWSVPDGELIAETAAHDGPIRDLAPHPRDQSVATAGEDGHIRLLDVPTRLPRIRTSGGKLASLVTSQDGLLLAANDMEGKVRLWQTVNGSQIGQLDGQNGRATAFAAGRRWVAVGDESGAIRFLKADTIQPAGNVTTGTSPITHLTIDDRAGTGFAVDADGTVRELTLPPENARSLRLPNGGITAIASFDGGRKAIVVGSDRKLLRLDMAGDAPAATTIGEVASAATAIDAFDDGSVVTGHADGSVELHGRSAGSLRFETGAAAVRAISTDSEALLAVTSHEDGTICEWDLSGFLVEQAAGRQAAKLVSIDPSGKLAALATGRNTVTVLTFDAGTLLKEIGPFDSELKVVTFSSDGSFLVTAEQSGEVRRFQSRTGQELAVSKADSTVSAMIGLSDSGEFLVGLESGAVQRWSITDGRLAELRPADTATIRQLALGTEGNLLVLAGRKVEHWNVASATKVGDISSDPATSVAFSADGKSPLIGESQAGERILLAGVATETGSFRISDAGSVTLLNAEGTATARWTLGERVLSAAADAGGASFAVVTADGRSHQVRFPSLRKLNTPPGVALTVGRNADGTGTLSVTNAGQVVRWAADSDEAEVVRQLDSGTTLEQAAIDGSGSVVVAAAGTSVFVWPTGTDTTASNPSKARPIPLSAGVRWLKLNHNGSRLLAGQDDGRVWLIDTVQRAVLEQLSVPTSDRVVVEFAADGDNILLGSEAAELKVLRPTVRRVLATDAKSIGDVAVTDATRQFCIVGNDGATRCWGDDTAPVINRSAADGDAARLTVISDNGEWVAQLFGESSVGVRRLRDGLEPTLFTAASSVHSLAISADGQLLAVADESGIRVVDRSGNLVQAIERQQPARLLTFVGGQSTLAIAREDGSIEFSAFSHAAQELNVGKPVSGVAYSATAGQLASWDDRRVRLWNLASGDEQLQFDDASSPILRAGFANGDQLLAGITHDGRVYVWSLAERKLRNQFAGPPDPRQAAIAANGLAIAVARQNGRVETYSLLNGQLLEVCNPESADLQSFDLRADDQAVFVGGRNGQITERSLSARASIAAHGTKPVSAATFSTRNGFLLSCGEDGTVAMHQFEGRLIRKFEGATGIPRGVAESPDGSVVLVISATEDAGELTVWKLADADLQRQMPLPVKPDFCREASATGLLAAVERSGRIQMVSTANGHPTERIVTIGDVHDAVIAGVADTVIATGSGGGLRAYPFQLDAAFRNPGVATAIDWSADGRFLASGTNGLISIWDVESRSSVAELPVPELPAYEPPVDDDKPAAKSKRPSARDTETRNNSNTARQPTGSRGKASETLATDGQSLANSPPGTLATQVLITPLGELCAAFVDGSVRVWDLKEATQPGEPPIPHTIFRHPSPVRAIAVDALGERIACGCEDSNIWVWEVSTGQELARFSGHEGAVTELAFESTGERLFSTGADRAAKVWPLNEGTLGSRAAIEIAMATSAEELRKALEQQLKSTQLADDRTRLRRVIRTLEGGDDSTASSDSSSNEDGEISRLRAALREATSTENRENMRRDLMVALKQKELFKRLTGTASQTERQRLQAELMQLNKSGYVTRQLNADKPVGRMTEIDRQLTALPSDESQKSDLRDKLQNMLRDTPIWPRTSRDTWSRDESHLLASLPTSFNFDTSLRPVELALTADGLTLAAARESAVLTTPKNTSGNKRRGRDNNDDEDDRQPEKRRAYGVVRVWDVMTGTEMRAWTDVEGSTVQAVQFAASGDTVVTSPDLFAFRLSTGESRELARNVAMATSSSGRLAAVGLPGQALEMADAVRLVDLDAMQFLPVQFAAYEATVPAIALSHDGTRLVAAVRERARHRLIEFDVQTLHEVSILEEFEHRTAWYESSGLPGITAITFSPDDRYVVAYGEYKQNDHRLTAVQMSNRKTSVIESRDPLVRRTSSVPFRFTGTRGHLVIDTPRGLSVVDMADGQEIDFVDFKSLPGGDRLLTLSGDGQIAAFGDEAGVITLRKLGQDQGRVHFQAHSGPVVGIAFSQGGRMLVTAGEENQIRIWSLAGFLHSRQPADPVEKNPQTGARRNRR